MIVSPKKRGYGLVVKEDSSLGWDLGAGRKWAG
jgi:hypothetical protein